MPIAQILRELEALGMAGQLAGTTELSADAELEFGRVRRQLESLLANPEQFSAPASK